MSEFTHYRCGGTLKWEVQDLGWARRSNGGDELGLYPSTEPIIVHRCDRCGRVGIAGPPPKARSRA